MFGAFLSLTVPVQFDARQFCKTRNELWWLVCPQDTIRFSATGNADTLQLFSLDPYSGAVRVRASLFNLPQDQYTVCRHLSLFCPSWHRLGNPLDHVVIWPCDGKWMIVFKVSVCACVCGHVCVCVCTCECMCVCVRVHVQTYMRACMCVREKERRFLALLSSAVGSRLVRKMDTIETLFVILLNALAKTTCMWLFQWLRPIHWVLLFMGVNY